MKAAPAQICHPFGPRSGKARSKFSCRGGGVEAQPRKYNGQRGDHRAGQTDAPALPPLQEKPGSASGLKTLEPQRVINGLRNALSRSMATGTRKRQRSSLFVPSLPPPDHARSPLGNSIGGGGYILGTPAFHRNAAIERRALTKEPRTPHTGEGRETAQPHSLFPSRGSEGVMVDANLPVGTPRVGAFPAHKVWSRVGRSWCRCCGR